VNVVKEPDGSFTARITGHTGLRVSVRSPIDLPRWTPSPRANRAAEAQAWGAMRTTLDAHEQDHRRIAQTERARMEGEWQAVDVSGTGATRAAARAAAVAELQALQQQWVADAQAAQDAIDPFRGAVLACPAPP
jgi:predicted secreted Zn-dependent protease